MAQKKRRQKLLSRKLKSNIRLLLLEKNNFQRSNEYEYDVSSYWQTGNVKTLRIQSMIPNVAMRSKTDTSLTHPPYLLLKKENCFSEG